MRDPFLAGRRLAPTAPVYHLRFLGRGINLQDQAVRAEWAVQRLSRRPDLKQGSHLIVAGGGIAGTIAALTATRNRKARWTVTLVEQQRLLSSLATSDRWIDPKVYLWPFDGWEEIRFELGGMHFLPGTASGFAAAYEQEFLRIAPSDLEILTGYRYLEGSGETDERLLMATFEPTQEGRRTIRRSTHALLVCSGIDPRAFSDKAGEVTDIGNYRGPKFWQTPPAGTEKTVVISGAGDGGLQDYLRYVLRTQELRKLVESVNQHLTQVVSSLTHIDRLATAWNSWLGDDPIQRCAVETWMHTRFRELAYSVPLAALEIVRKHIHSDVLSCQREVFLLVRCRHFGQSYPINVLLTHLIDRCLLDESKPIRTIHLGATLRAVDHETRCRRKKIGSAHCFGETVRVTWTSNGTCASRSRSDDPISVSADAVLIRHGLQFGQYEDDGNARPSEIMPTVPWPSP